MMHAIKSRFGDAAFWKPAIRLGFPVALQNLLVSSFALVDTLMLGQLGDAAVASVGMAGQWSWLLNIFFYGFSSGAAVFLSQYWGAKDFKGIRRTYGILLLLVMGMAVLMGAAAFFAPTLVIRIFSNDPIAIETGAKYLRIAGFSYLSLGLTQVFCTVLRSTEEVRLPLYASLCGVICNTILNYALIFGRLGLPALGVEGAAIATVISSSVSPIVLLITSLRRRNLLTSSPREMFSFDRAFVAHYIRVSLPALVNEGIWALGTTGYNMVFGRLGTAQYAALTIFRTIEGMFFAFYVGLCHACGVLVGREIGAGNEEESVRYANRFTVALPVISVGLGLLMIATRGLFLRLFDVSPDVMRMARAIMLIYALEVPIRNISYITICGVFRPGGDTKTGLLYDIVTVWLLALPVTAICGLVLGLDFIWVYLLMLVCEDWPKAILCIRRLRSRKWVMPVTR